MPTDNAVATPTIEAHEMIERLRRGNPCCSIQLLDTLNALLAERAELVEALRAITECLVQRVEIVSSLRYQTSSDAQHWQRIHDTNLLLSRIGGGK